MIELIQNNNLSLRLNSGVSLINTLNQNATKPKLNISYSDNLIKENTPDNLLFQKIIENKQLFNKTISSNKDISKVNIFFTNSEQGNWYTLKDSIYFMSWYLRINNIFLSTDQTKSFKNESQYSFFWRSTFLLLPNLVKFNILINENAQQDKYIDNFEFTLRQRLMEVLISRDLLYLQTFNRNWFLLPYEFDNILLRITGMLDSLAWFINKFYHLDLKKWECSYNRREFKNKLNCKEYQVLYKIFNHYSNEINIIHILRNKIHSSRNNSFMSYKGSTADVEIVIFIDQATMLEITNAVNKKNTRGFFLKIGIEKNTLNNNEHKFIPCKFIDYIFSGFITFINNTLEEIDYYSDLKHPTKSNNEFDYYSDISRDFFRSVLI